MSYSKDDHLKWDLALLMPSTFISHVRYMLSWSKINQKYETEKLRDSPKRITFAIGYNGLFEIVKMKWSYALYDLLIHCPFSRWFSHIACSQAIIPNCIKDTKKRHDCIIEFHLNVFYFKMPLLSLLVGQGPYRVDYFRFLQA